MSVAADQLAAVRDLIEAAGKRVQIGGKEVSAFVGYIDTDTGLPVMGGGTMNGRTLSIVAESSRLPTLKRDLPVVIGPSVRLFKVEGWEEHEGFVTINCR